MVTLYLPEERGGVGGGGYYPESWLGQAKTPHVSWARVRKEEGSPG